MSRTIRRFSALGAFFVLPVALAACGGSVPADSVATVNGMTIQKDTFNHWMKVAAVSTAAQQNPSATSPKASVPDAPDFKQCIAEKRQTTPAPAKGQPQVTDAQLKTQCQQQYDTLKSSVMSFLIRSTWLDAEASKEKVSVSDKEVQKSIDAAKKQAFPNPADFQKYLARSGLTEADVFFQQRSQLLQQKITQRVTKGKDKVSEAQAQAYYNKNKQQFATPEKRDLRIVLTKDKATAEKAKRALESGQSWKTIAKKYSIDQASKNNGGLLPGVSKGQQEKALDDATFAAKKGKLVGPIKTQFGYYVFDVTGITQASQQSFNHAKASIQQQLAQQNQQKALTNFGNGYRNEWKSKTDCRKGYVTDDCKNAPKSKSSTTSTTSTTQ